ncbi:membrane protein insertion efficiency factor YidD [Candidatus Peregrinibacteria bacterium]|nr:MAG: membrane protein insertion efficiency factor YidD [Candidatus Peregrinibacteria bacterium]
MTHCFKKIPIGLIKLYQKTLSPDHSIWAKTLYPHGYCQFSPSCSQYMIEAIEKEGIIKGIAKGIWRILSCNPCRAVRQH